MGSRQRHEMCIRDSNDAIQMNNGDRMIDASTAYTAVELAEQEAEERMQMCIRDRQWFVAHAVIRFERLKDTVQTETGERLIMAGELFKVLIPRASDIRAKWMAAVAPKQLCHKATKDEIIEH